MKKFWIILVLSICLVFVISMGASAKTTEIIAYFDTYWLGTWSQDYDPLGKVNDYNDNDLLKGTVLGVDIFVNKFKFGYELENDSPQEGDDFAPYDYTTSILKGGIQIFGNKKAKIHFTLSNYNKEFDVSKATISGLIPGIDGLWNISDRMFLQGSIGMSVNAKQEYKSDDWDAFILLENVKFNYMFTDNFGLGVGFRNDNIYVDNEGDLVIYNGGFTIGATARF